MPTMTSSRVIGTCFDRLVRMQHYGLPTRLLDVSGNPLVALFFACYGAPKLLNIDGEVIVFRVSSDKVRYYDSDTVSCLANLSNLTYAQKSEIDLKLDVGAFNQTGVAEKLLHHIKSEKGFFEGRIAPDDLGSIVCVKAKRTNTRIKSQSGAFLLFGHEVALPELGQEGIEIARVTITSKQHILYQLDSININATTVYPSIDQTAVHLRERVLSSPLCLNERVADPSGLACPSGVPNEPACTRLKAGRATRQLGQEIAIYVSFGSGQGSARAGPNVCSSGFGTSSCQSAVGQLRTDQVGTDTVRTTLANGCDPKAIRSRCNRNRGVMPAQPAPLSVKWETQHALFTRYPARRGRPPPARLVFRGRAQRTPG